MRTAGTFTASGDPTISSGAPAQSRMTLWSAIAMLKTAGWCWRTAARGTPDITLRPVTPSLTSPIFRTGTRSFIRPTAAATWFRISCWVACGGIASQLSGQNREMAARPWMGVGTPVGAMAYDTSRSKLVMFPDANGVVEICDPATNKCTAPTTSGTAPPNTGWIGFAYNSSDHKVYTFTGNNVYTFDAGTNTWASVATTCSGASCVSGKPPARVAAGWAYSTRDNIFLLAGGIAGTLGSGTLLNDTWVFDPAARSWT